MCAGVLEKLDFTLHVTSHFEQDSPSSAANRALNLTITS
jgi:hypothetical protein